MKFNLKNSALILTASLSLCAFAAPSFAQDAAETFKATVEKMTPSDWTNEDQIKEMENAQKTWMNLCLQQLDQREATLSLMKDALAQDYPTATKQWLLHLVGWVGDDSCVDVLASFLASDEPALFDEAARALVQIGSEKAVAALNAAKEKIDDPKKIEGYLVNVNVDLSIGVETELPQALPYASDKEFADYMAKFNDLSDDDKARALGAIRVKDDPAYLEIALDSLKSENEFVKRAAILAVEKIGSGKNFDALYDAFSFDRGLVERVMGNIVSDDFNAALAAALKKEKNNDYLVSLAYVASLRYDKEEVATLLDLAKKDDCAVRLQLLTAAEQLASKKNIPDFVNAFLAIPKGEDRDRAEQIISRLCDGDATPVVKMMNNDNGAQIFMLLGRIGGDAALEQMEKGLASGQPQMVALTIRAMSNWPNAVVWEKLLDAAKDQKLPEQIRIQALRAFARVVSLPDDRDGIDMSDADKLANLKTAFELATRDDERNLVLERVGAVRTLDSVRFALSKVDEAALSDKAMNAILDLAHQDYLRKQDKELFKGALDVVIEKGNDQQRDRATGYKNNIK